MNLTSATQNVLEELKEAVMEMDSKNFKQPIPILSLATIGQHVRHVIEIFNCFIEGYQTGCLNYDNRERDITIEQNKLVALKAMEKIILQLPGFDLEKTISLEGNYDMEESSIPDFIKTSAGREIAYNLEHAIHHMALIKIGMKEICPEINLPQNFGVAYSTIKYKAKVCAQ